MYFKAELLRFKTEDFASVAEIMYVVCSLSLSTEMHVLSFCLPHVVLYVVRASRVIFTVTTKRMHPFLYIITFFLSWLLGFALSPSCMHQLFFF